MEDGQSLPSPDRRSEDGRDKEEQSVERFWKAALGVAGLGAVAFFTFFSLYKQWLTLKIFPTLTQSQAFVLMLVFLGLTFLALLVGVIAWFRKPTRGEGGDAALHRLELTWAGVNYIDCDRLVGPDVNKAANALEMTSLYWRRNFLDRDILLEKHASNYRMLFEQLDACDKPVPGYTKPKKHCKDFLPAHVRSTYSEIIKATK
jgi:hypothetical protein